MSKNCFPMWMLSVTILASLAATAGVLTPLSQRASQLKLGMTRAEAIDLLGHATWASIPGDRGEFAPSAPEVALELFWRNPGCKPVVVDFDRDFKVIGWDEDRDCLPDADVHLGEPPDKFSCRRPDRAGFCQ
jgi:hypothetical protein